MLSDLLKEVIVPLCCSAASSQSLCVVLGMAISEGYEAFRKHPKEDYSKGGKRSQGSNCQGEAGIISFIQLGES